MIRFIAAVDNKLGMANGRGIPWQGKIPGDVKYFRRHTENNSVLMGYGTYMEFEKPLPSRRNVVASSKDEQLRPGFELTQDARAFLDNASEDVWVIGGPGLFAATLDLADELYITQLDQDFQCTKFFPEFRDKFELKSESQPVTENGITYTFQFWARK